MTFPIQGASSFKGDIQPVSQTKRTAKKAPPKKKRVTSSVTPKASLPANQSVSDADKIDPQKNPELYLKAETEKYLPPGMLAQLEVRLQSKNFNAYQGDNSFDLANTEKAKRTDHNLSKVIKNYQRALSAVLVAPPAERQQLSKYLLREFIQTGVMPQVFGSYDPWSHSMDWSTERVVRKETPEGVSIQSTLINTTLHLPSGKLTNSTQAHLTQKNLVKYNTSIPLPAAKTVLKPAVDHVFKDPQLTEALKNVQQHSGDVVLKGKQGAEDLENLLSPLQKSLAEKFHLPGLQLRIVSGEGGERGLYDDETNEILLNITMFKNEFSKLSSTNPKEEEKARQELFAQLLGTMAHELTHAWLYQMSTQYKKSPETFKNMPPEALQAIQAHVENEKNYNSSGLASKYNPNC